jgi:hypothetical protein
MIYFWRDIIFKSRHVIILRAVGIGGPGEPGMGGLFKSLHPDFDSHRSNTFFFLPMTLFYFSLDPQIFRPSNGPVIGWHGYQMV